MRKWIPLFLTFGGFALSVAVHGQLEPRVALDVGKLLPLTPPGDPDVLPRFVAAFGLPSLALLLWGLLHEAPVSRIGRAAGRLFPARSINVLSVSDYEKFAPSYRLIVIWAVSLVLAMHVAILAAALAWPVHPGLIVGLVLGAGLLVVGNVMPRLRPNPVAGIRTARTMQDPLLWAQVHRRYGAFFLIGGAVVLAVAVLAPRYALTVGAATLLITSLASLVAPRTMMLGLSSVIASVV